MILYTKGLVQKDVNGEITVIVSDETVDRAGESLAVKNWDLSNFNTAPRMFVDHDYRVEALTGMWKNARVEDGKLKMVPVFHELTEVARVNKELVASGFLNTVSVGYLQRKRADGTMVYELLEVSWVGVPCNPNARVERLTIKDIEGNEAKAVEDFVNAFIKEMETQEAAPQDAPVEAVEPEVATDPEVAVPVEPEPPQAEPEHVEDGKAVKGIIDDSLEAARQVREAKYAYMDQAWFAFIKFSDAYMLATAPVESFKAICEDFCSQLMEIANQTEPEPMDDEVMLMSIEKFMENRGFAKPEKKSVEAEQKAGRVLSEKNRGIIQASLDAMTGSASAMSEATAALSELLKANEPSQGDESAEEIPANEETPDDLKSAREVLAMQRRIVKACVTQMSESLNKLKFPRGI